MKTAKLIIDGAWTEVMGFPSSCLTETLAPLDPRRYFNSAWKQRRWDGRVRLYEGRRFPTGLVHIVKNYIEKRGVRVEIVDQTEHVEVDMSTWNRNILPGITLFDHQDEVCQALLAVERGVAKSPTGSGKTEMIAAIAKFLYQQLKWRTLIMVPKRGLAHQTVQRLRGYFEDEITVGQYGDGQKTTGIVTVATGQSLSAYKAKYVKGRGLVPADRTLFDLIRNCEVLIPDEAHHASSDTWYEIAMASRAKRRYGFSGTPLKEEEPADMRLMGTTGPVVVEIPAERLIGLGLSARPKIAMVMSDSASGPELEGDFDPESGDKKPKPYRQAYELGVVNNEDHNRSVIRAVSWLVDLGRRTLVICRRKDHFRILDQKLKNAGIDYGSAWGATVTGERDRIKKLFTGRNLDCILATTIFDEGEDLPTIDAIVLAEGIKSNTNSIQRIGRGMRRKEGDNDLWVVDFVPTCHPTLLKHGEARCRAYEREGYEVLLVESWPVRGEPNPKGMLPFIAWEEAYAATT